MGHQIIPLCTAIHDVKWGFRINQGWYHRDSTYNIVVQKNRKPHSEILAMITVNPKVDTGDGVIDRLAEDAKKKGLTSYGLQNHHHSEVICLQYDNKE